MRAGLLRGPLQKGRHSLSQVVQLFTNPRSGSYSARRLRALVRAFEDLGAGVLQSESAAGCPVIDSRATHICIAAGDGTVRHVAAAAVRDGRALPLSIYPAGTVNLLAMEAGYPRNPRRFARMVLAEGGLRQHYPVAIGPAASEQAYFFACAGVGPDSLAVDRVSPRLKKRIGRLAYLVAGTKLLGAWPRPHITLSHPGGETACEAFYVAKGRYYGGRWSFAKEARVHEPLLHVVALETARRRDYARFLWCLVRHADSSALSFVHVFTCTALSAAADEPLPLQADGDTVDTLPVTLTLCETPLGFCQGVRTRQSR